MSDTPQNSGVSHGARRQPNASAAERFNTARPSARSNDGNSTSGGSTSGGLSPIFVLRALGQWWKVATPLGIALAALAVGAIWLLFEPQYESMALLRIEDRQPRLIPGRGAADNSAKFARTQLEIIHSSLVMEEVLAQPDIARFEEILAEEDPARWLASAVTARALKGSELYTITLTGKHPDHSAAIVNAVADAYFNLQNSEKTRRTQEIIRLLEVEKKRRELEVTRLRTNVYDLTRDVSGGDLASGGGKSRFTLNSPLSTVQQQLIDAEVDGELLEATIKAFEKSIAEGTVKVSAAMLGNAVERHEEVVGYKQWIAQNEALLEEIAAVHVLGEKAPRYQRLAKENLKAQSDLDEVRTKLRNQFSEEIKQQQINIRKDQLAQLNARLANHQLREKLLQARYEKMMETLAESSGQSLQLEFRRAELDREEKVLELIAGRIVELLTEIRAPARVTMLKRATAAAVPIERVPMKLMSFAGVIGLLLPFGLAVFWEKIVCRVNDSKQLKLSNLDVVGEIATIPNRNRVWALSGKSERGLNLYEESVDSLRTSLVLAELTKDMTILSVTSAISREGKTSLASQLAVSLAGASGMPTLLIDGDMRSPDMHNVFEIDNDRGLTQVLAGECSIDEAIVTNWSSHLHLLPAGPLTVSPHKLLGQGALDRTLSQLRDTYHYIVIDTPPVLSASESLVICKSADVTLLCTMREVSRLDQVTAAYDRLTASGARPVRTVLNGVHASRYAYYYGSYAYQRS